MSTPSTACRRLGAGARVALGLVVSAPGAALSQTPVAYGSGLAAELGIGQASVGTGFGSSGMVALRATSGCFSPTPRSSGSVPAGAGS